MNTRSFLTALAACATILLGVSHEASAGARYKWKQGHVLLAALNSALIYHFTGKSYYEALDGRLFPNGRLRWDTRLCTSEEIMALDFMNESCVTATSDQNQRSDCNDDNNCSSNYVSEYITSDAKIMRQIEYHIRFPCKILTDPATIRDFNVDPNSTVYTSSRDVSPRGMYLGASELWRLAGCSTASQLSIASFEWDTTRNHLIVHFQRTR